MAEYETILLERDGPVATIPLNRPDRLNAFTVQMLEDLVAAFDAIDADDEVRAVVVTGQGRGFCAGADLAAGASTFELGPGEEFDMDRHADTGGILVQRIYACAKPVIAAINGPAVGVGITMTLPMDVRLASDAARMGFVFARRGLVPEACSSWFLPRIVGISQAAEWVFTGRVFDAQEAHAAGLVRSVHPPDELLPAARELAAEMADGTSAVAVALSRRMLWRMLAAPGPEVAHRVDSEAIFELGRGADVAEGVEAFLEKRPPRFPLRVSTDMPGIHERLLRGSVAPR